MTVVLFILGFVFGYCAVAGIARAFLREPDAPLYLVLAVASGLFIWATYAVAL